MEQYQTVNKELFHAVLNGNRHRSSDLIQAMLINGSSVTSIYKEVLKPLLVQLGTEWSKQNISISDEHLATQVVLECMSDLRKLIEPVQLHTGKALITSLPGDLHIVGGHMVADFFYSDGWNIEFLGANTPLEEIVSRVEKKETDVVLISLSSNDFFADFNTLGLALSSTKRPPMLIGGGRGISGRETDKLLSIANLITNDPEEAVSKAREHCKLNTEERSLQSILTKMGRRILTLRNSQGISQKKLSEASSLDRAYLSSIENGKKNISISALYRIAQALRVDLTDLLADEETYNK